jgi:alpha,alpha-trehalase
MEIKGYKDGKAVDRTRWRASNLFGSWRAKKADRAWSATFTLDEIPRGSYLCIALNGRHGIEGAYAAARVDGKPVGAPDRSISYPSNTWEYKVRETDRNYTYYIPLTEDMKGKKIDAVVLGMKDGTADFKAEVWITAYPAPFERKRLILTPAGDVTGGSGSRKLLEDVTTAFSKLQPQCIRPAEGYIRHDYLIPGGYYKQMWDWDGFFIGCHLASQGRDRVKYLKEWVLNFANSADGKGYVSGCITTEGPRPIFGKFSMKPFLSQGAYLAGKWSNDFGWITPDLYDRLKSVLSYRESTQYDPAYGLFFWNNAMQSGADNNVTLTNDPGDTNAILGTDINTFQLREYLSMAGIAGRLGYTSDKHVWLEKARRLKKAMMEVLWSENDHSFFNVRRDNGQPIKRISYSNFVPLMEGDELLTRAEGRAMIKKYLLNKACMLADFGLRSLSLQDSAYNNQAIITPYSNWQGPAWMVADYLYFIGLVKYGFRDEARELSLTLGRMLLKDIEACGSMHEDYNADNGDPLAPTAAQSKDGIFPGFVGWNLLVQNMLEGTLENKWMLLDIPSA